MIEVWPEARGRGLIFAMDDGGSLSGHLRERLLRVMDRKHHGAFVHLTRPGLSRAQILVHFRHELHTYVRDFPVLLARVLGQGPPESVRHALSENIYEEQTGKLSLGRPHPELFMVMMEGLGFSRSDLEAREPALVPEALTYRAFLDQVSVAEPWQVGCAVLTIFVEGSIHERAEIQGQRQHADIDALIRKHPMVAHYGCSPDSMLLARAHHAVEGDHRIDAWRSVLDHVDDQAMSDAIGRSVERALTLWLSYRDGVARAMDVPVLPG